MYLYMHEFASPQQAITYISEASLPLRVVHTLAAYARFPWKLCG